MSRYKLITDSFGIALEDRFSDRTPLRLNFDEREFRSRLRKSSVKSELIARAVKASPGLRVLDCTAGLGRDGFILAYLGCEVTMLERSVVMYTLIADALRRAALIPDLQKAVKNTRLIQCDAAVYLQCFLEDKLEAKPKNKLEDPSPQRERMPYDVLYLDPMFPSRNKTALAKGPMQYLQDLIGKDDDAAGLLDCAMESGCSKIVIKRPAHSAWKPPIPPNHVLTSKTSRFEVFYQAV